MRKIVVLFAAVALLASCNSKKANTEVTEKVITVSILPQKTFVQKIAGNDFKINVLVPPGSNPEAGNLLPSQLKDIANSDIWLRIGHIGFEYSWGEKIRQANTKMKEVDLSEGLDLIAETEQHGDHVHESGIDPHVWLSPGLVKQMSKRILDEVSTLNPQNADKYSANYTRFSNEIDSLDRVIKNKLKGFEGRKIIVFHPSLSYFARDYGLDQHALESGGKEPTPQQMMRTVDLARKENIKVIYIQSEFDRDHARVFAEEIDGSIIQVSPLEADWTNNLLQMTNYFIENF